MYHFFKRPTRTRHQRKTQEREILAFLVRRGLVDPEITYRQAARKISKLMYQRRDDRRGPLSSCLLIDEDGPEATYYISVVNRRVIEMADRHLGKVSPRMAMLRPEEIVNKAPPTIVLGTRDVTTRLVDGTIIHDDASGTPWPAQDWSEADPHIKEWQENAKLVNWDSVIPKTPNPGSYLPPDQFLTQEAKEHPAGHVVTTHVTEHEQRRNAGRALKYSSIWVDVDGDERRVVGEVTDSGIVNMMEVADDGTTRPLTGMFSTGVYDVSSRAESAKVLSIAPDECPWLTKPKPSDFSLRPAGGIPANLYGTDEYKPIPEIGDLITEQPKEDPNAG